MLNLEILVFIIVNGSAFATQSTIQTSRENRAEDLDPRDRKNQLRDDHSRSYPQSFDFGDPLLTLFIPYSELTITRLTR